ncbi:hypothetical protein L3X38_041535 [Prunus dulcis]|uniref:Uncharacterized protein n=1 Tax=Prunus dulcis TaxID=3755 RepID=A0AAD4UV40_PRUDU|nr:hypothetical protein L3X38_041535 [Prunus dulcis]
MGIAPNWVFSAEGSLGFFLNGDTFLVHKEVAGVLEDLTSAFLFGGHSAKHSSCLADKSSGSGPFCFHLSISSAGGRPPSSSRY